MRYVFDNIGNRTSSYEDATSKTYDANCLNQYTEIDVTGGSSVCPLYDDDGNMTQFDSSTYTYDAENRLVGAQNGTTRLEFIYDALGRRVARKLYLNNTLSKHHRYVYDGMKLLATYNAKSSFAKINSFLWQPFGLDVPLIMTYNSTVYGYLVDANKNVLGLFNPSKTRVATYLYGPFGQKLSESGTIAANNPLQFSSEQFDADLGLIYYNYRYYLPSIGKWLTKDPIGEQGGWNLYAFCGNNAVNTWDENGNNGKRKLIDYWNAPANYLMTGKPFPSDEEVVAAYNGLQQIFTEEYDAALNTVVDSISCNISCVKESRYYAMAEGFLSGLSSSARNEYWSDVFLHNDIGFSLSLNADYAIGLGGGGGVEIGWTVLSGWKATSFVDLTVGFGANVGLSFSTSISKHHKASHPASPTISIPSGFGTAITWSEERIGLSYSPKFTSVGFGSFITVSIPFASTSIP